MKGRSHTIKVAKIVEHGLNKGVKEIEVFAEEIKRKEIVIQDNRLRIARQSIHNGCGIRCIVDRKMGFSYSSSPSQRDEFKACELAIKMARNSYIDNNYSFLKGPFSYKEVPGTSDSAIIDSDIDHISSLALKLKDLCRNHSAHLSYGRIELINANRRVSNSNCIDCEDMSTLMKISFEGTAKKGAGKVNKYLISRQFVEKNEIENLLYECLEKTANLTGIKKVKNFRGCIVLSPEISNIFIRPYVSTIARDISRIGEEVMNDGISIFDDGTIPYGVYSSKFDGEGHPTKRNLVVCNGILESIIADTYTAKRFGKKPTGNALRNDYSSVPFTAPNNLVVQAGDVREEDIIELVERGIYVDRLKANQTIGYGHFIARVDGYSIERGRVKHPVKDIEISGNIFESLSKASKSVSVGALLLRDIQIRNN